MLTFRNKEEEEFWKQTFLASLSHNLSPSNSAKADSAVIALRLRQPVQQFPEVPKE